MPSSTATFTQTRIDIADFYTTLSCLKGEMKSALGIDSPAAYASLYQKVYDGGKGGCSYQDAADGGEAKILGRLNSFSCSHKFWKLYVPESNEKKIAQYAWREFIPIQASLRETVNYVKDLPPRLKVSLIPWVILFPFGWSNWLSFRIVGPHTLRDLSSLVTSIAQDTVLTMTPGRNPLKLMDLLDNIKEGARTDAFHKDADDRRGPELLITVTVTARGSGLLSSGALDTYSDYPDLQNIVSPDNPGHDSAGITDRMYRIKKDDCDFVVWDRFGRFISFYTLLDVKDGTNYSRLNCYHWNTFLSQVFAWHQIQLLQTDPEIIGKDPAPALKELLAGAVKKLSESRYMSAGLWPLIHDEKTKVIIASACQKFNLT